MKVKKWASLLCAAALAASLAACGAQTSKASADETTLIGQVSAVDGSAVTLLLGTLEDSGTETAPSAPNQSGQTGTPPEKPDGNGSAPTDEGEAPPEMPEGDAPSAGNGQTPPEKPDGSVSNENAPAGQPGGSAPSRNPPEAPSGSAPSMPGKRFTAGTESVTLDFTNAKITENGEDAALDDIAVGDVLTVEVDTDNTVTSAAIVSIGTGGPGGFGGSGEVTQGSNANTIAEDGVYEDLSYFSTGDDENALRIDGATVTLSGVSVDKSAGATSNTEDGDFYGMNAALLATNGATVTIQNATVTSAAQNGNGVFSYGSGTTVNISDSTITTTADNSGGIQTTGDGTTNVQDLTVETSGNSSAAIRSDRGGGTVNVAGGTYTSNGYNSPAVYFTADISVTGAVLTANNSEALVIEGKNSITLDSCTISGNMSDTKGSSSDENVHNVMIYQSMSGDADVGTSTLSMTGGSLTGKNGDLFYVTNTHCVLTLSSVTLYNEDADACLLRATVNIIENAEGGAAVSDNAVVTIDSGCVWNLTGDCTVTSLTNNGTINFNSYTITLADGTVLR